VPSSQRHAPFAALGRPAPHRPHISGLTPLHRRRELFQRVDNLSLMWVRSAFDKSLGRLGQACHEGAVGRSGQAPDFRFARLHLEMRRWMTLMLGLVVALAGCSAVQPSTSSPVASTEKGAANVERDEDRRRDETPLGPRPAPPEPDRSGSHVVEIALKYVGTLYRWGGASPGGFDCSGFVRYVYSRVGVSLPHNAAKQYRYGRPVPRDELQPGDLVFFDGLRHNGIYVGNGKFIHSRQTGKRVSVARLDDDWYDTHWVGARRL
jgi:hypothetical protein